MSEKINVDIESNFIENFFSLADVPVPDEVNSDSLSIALGKIKKKLTTLASMVSSEANEGEFELADNAYGQTVLVVDDLGIITIQLESLFKKYGFEVTVSKELFDAIDKYKTQDFDFAVVDLFIPTEREGFILIDEIKKLSLLCKLNTKIIVMSASSKKEHQQKAVNKGADLFVEKTMGWQDKIVEFCLRK